MNHTCCPDCRVRFPPELASYLPTCPGCGQPLQPLSSPTRAMGYRLFRLDDIPVGLLRAGEARIPLPDPGQERS